MVDSFLVPEQASGPFILDFAEKCETVKNAFVTLLWREESTKTLHNKPTLPYPCAAETLPVILQKKLMPKNGRQKWQSAPGTGALVENSA